MLGHLVHVDKHQLIACYIHYEEEHKPAVQSSTMFVLSLSTPNDVVPNNQQGSLEKPQSCNISVSSQCLEVS